MARLLYGTGMRLMECVRLRVKDVDFARGEILVRDGKGAKDRVTMLPQSLAADLQSHLKQRRALFDDDVRAGKGAVYLPHALAQKYPNAPTEWGWQYVFPPGSYSIDPRSGVERRHHLDEKLLQRAMMRAVRSSGLLVHLLALLPSVLCAYSYMTSIQTSITSAQTMSAEVVKKELDALVKVVTDDNGVVAVDRLAMAVRNLTSPLKDTAGAHESQSKMEEARELELDFA